MTARCFKPAPGTRIRMPDGSLFPAAGQQVPATPYFARLIAAGDLMAVTKTKPHGSKSA